MHRHGYHYQELPVRQLQRDPDQPRRDFGTEGDENRLLVSIRQYGIEEPIKVSEINPGQYLIIDGHRRYICAQKLGLETVPCRIYPKLGAGELETRRYEMQNNRRSWKPMERSDALERIKAANGYHTNREVAELLGMTETTVNNSFQLRRQKLEYIELMEHHGLPESARIEFVRLKPKIRKIRDIEADEIILCLFDKVSHRIIKNVRDFRKLGTIFSKASSNEEELYRFLTSPDMTISELEQRVTQSGFSYLLEEVVSKITTKRQEGIAFTTKERLFLAELQSLLITSL